MTRLKELRLSSGETQAEIAAIIGITRAAYTNIEIGKREPDYTTLCTLADHFGVSVDYLLGRTDIKKEPAPKGDEPGDPLDVQLMELLCRMPPDQKKWLLEKIDTLLELQ